MSRYQDDANYRERCKQQRLARYRADKDGAIAKSREYNATPAAKARARALNRKKMRERSGAVNASSESPDGPCQLCSAPTQGLHYDHDHATGAFRGWLCGSCNRALGLFKDDARVMARAARYVSPIVDAIFDE